MNKTYKLSSAAGASQSINLKSGKAVILLGAAQQMAQAA